jgi:hypothetical protein
VERCFHPTGGWAISWAPHKTAIRDAARTILFVIGFLIRKLDLRLLHRPASWIVEARNRGEAGELWPIHVGCDAMRAATMPASKDR